MEHSGVTVPWHAYSALKQANGEDAIHTSIQDVFARHNMEDKYVFPVCLENS